MRGVFLLLCLLLTACSTPVPVGTPVALGATATPTAPAKIPTGDAPAAEAGIPVSSLTPTANPPSPTPLASPTPMFTPTPMPMPWMGVEAHNMTSSFNADLAAQAGVQIVRLNGVVWHQVQPTDAEPLWFMLGDLDKALVNLSERGIVPLVIVRGTPDWAQKVSGSFCGPIAEDKLLDFVAFMRALVMRYSVPPYNVHFWELGNEPDVDAAMFLNDRQMPFGCWGDPADEFYGGGYYAQMLKAVYPVIKEVDPSATVLFGGLLLDCDPTNPPEGKDCSPAKFFEGALRAGAADYFDVVSFHGYPPIALSSLRNDANFPNWRARGGVIVGKIDFLREVMARYDVTKPLFHSEGSLICPEWNKNDCTPPGSVFYEKQAEFVIRMYVRNWAMGIYGTTWYSFEGQGWRYGGMVGNANNPKLAYRVYQFLMGYLRSAVYIGRADVGAGVDAYLFEQPDGKRLWVLWSVDESPIPVQIPMGARVLDMYGAEVTVTEGVLAVAAPVYVELP